MTLTPSVHLTPEQFIEAIDGAPSVPSARHLETCDQCRLEIASLTEMMGDVQAIEMAEPSPLFWDHFSRRVQEATAAEAQPALSWWRRGWQPLVAAGMAAGALALVFVVRTAPVATGPGAGNGSAFSIAASAAGIDEAAADDGSWRVVAEMAGDLKSEDLQQVARATPDATAALMGQLTPAQQAEFVRMVKAQMGGVE